MTTFTDDTQLLQLVSEYKAAVAAMDIAHKAVVNAANDHVPIGLLQDVLEKYAALCDCETRLTAGFVCALEHGER